MSTASKVSRPAQERIDEILESLVEIRSRVQAAASSSSTPGSQTLVAVSKYKPSGDILVCHENGQLDFGENYVQELVDKAQELPQDIRWHFIGTLQSNKSKILASIPNLYAIETLTSAKAATALNKAMPAERTSLLNVFLQVNTSGEDSKSGVPPLTASSTSDAELVQLAHHVSTACPRLRLQGLMTIGSIDQSLSDSENKDFETLKVTRDALHKLLEADASVTEKSWGQEGRLLLSMGMSSDFEAALKADADVVRVGTGIFGSRHKKGEGN
ncbi:hypothetical protein FIBSPDRAFT_746671 [Athelia psychrophila]|uniref:Pyridoxal phosphate homeostasis protein n=1 Tax=Athelia psychrophila TaxID=1759441 RepID=A0A166GBU0_9AGAM|nr:hypothetical protein FIBSPDRAFT_746671 [Fibularhizoctonia sp. CBS 109695]